MYKVEKLFLLNRILIGICRIMHKGAESVLVSIVSNYIDIYLYNIICSIFLCIFTL